MGCQPCSCRETRALRIRLVEMSIAAELIRLLSRRHRTHILSGQHGDHAFERLIGTSLGLLRLQRGQRVPDTHSGIVRVAEGFGMRASRIHEGLRAQEHGRDAAIFESQNVVHTARHARASIPDSYDHEVTAFGQFVDDGRLGDA
jgi:hypothetical protein